jgi:hypothetical protein
MYISVLAEYRPSLYYLIFALIGGILALIWYGMIGYNLWRTGRKTEKAT